jgi:hypothetical protein
VINLQYRVIPAGEVVKIVSAFPRLDIKQEFRRCFCHIARPDRKPPTTTSSAISASASSPARAPSVVDLLETAPFEG